MSLADLLSDTSKTQRERLRLLRENWRGELERLDDDALHEALRAIEKAITSRKLRGEVLQFIGELRRDGAGASAPLPRPAPPPPKPAPASVSTSAPEREGQHDAELEGSLRASPQDGQTWQVYRDWLEGHGLVTDGRVSLGRLAECDDMLTEVEWRHGFIRSARLSYSLERFNGEHPPVSIEQALSWLLDEPGPGRLIEQLTIGLALHDDNDYRGICQVIGAHLRPCLIELEIGDFGYEECELNWSTIGDASALWPAVPNLRSLWLRAGAMQLGDIVLPELRSFETVTGGMPNDALRSIAHANWPKLERLHLQIGTAGQGATTDVALVEPILAGAGLPALTHLGLTNCEFTDELCERLGSAPILRQLRHLDLSMGTMSLAGAQALARRAQSFAHLDGIVVDDNYLPDEARELLACFGPALDFGVQREEGRYGRFASAFE